MKIKNKTIETKYVVIVVSVLIIVMGIWFFSTQSTRAFGTLPNGTIQLLNSEGKEIPMTIKIADTADARRNAFKNVSKTVVNESTLFIPYSSTTNLRISVDKVKIPLDIAFFDEDGALISILHTRVGNQSYRPGDNRYQYVLMAHNGYFRKQDIIARTENVQLLIDTLAR